MLVNELLDALAAKYGVEVYEAPDDATSAFFQNIAAAAIAEVAKPPHIRDTYMEIDGSVSDDVILQAASIACVSIGLPPLSEAEKRMFKQSTAPIRSARLFRPVDGKSSPYYIETLQSLLRQELP